MSWAVVARKDFEDAVRSKMLWGITGLFVLFAGIAVYAQYSILGGDPSAAEVVQFLSVPSTQIIPITALVAAYMSIAGERESGSIKILLGLPHTRRDVVLGKLLGRTGVVAAAVFVAFAIAAIMTVALFGSLPFVKFVLLTLVTVLFGLSFVGIAVGLSAMTATRSRALAGAVGLFAVFQILWNLIPLGVYYLIEGGLPSGEVPTWYPFIQIVSPQNAYAQVVDFVMSGSGSLASADQLAVDQIPFYLQNWFGLVVLAFWLTVPVVLGYLRFRGADLG